MSNLVSSRSKFPSVVDGVKYDIEADYPSVEVEVYYYKLKQIVMYTCTVTYSDATKEVILTVEWT